MILYFAIAGYDILNEIDQLDKDELIEFVYSHQIVNGNKSGFSGSLSCGCKYFSEKTSYHTYDCSHVTMTYTALSILIILGDDLSRINKPALLDGLKSLEVQLIPGSYQASINCPENDARFIYSAVASAYILGDINIFDKKKILAYFESVISYQGGFGQAEYLESHAGITYCVISSAYLLGILKELIPDNSKRKERLLRWLVSLQTQGLHGRTNKPDDTCYTFWIGASLRILGHEHFINKVKLFEFLKTAYHDKIHAFSKLPGAMPDPIHTYLTLSGLSSLSEKTDLEELSFKLNSTCPALNMTMRARQNLDKIHKSRGRPDECCDSSCPNCVWMAYTDKVKKEYQDNYQTLGNNERLKFLEEIESQLSTINDPSVKYFLLLEFKEFKREIGSKYV